MTELDPRGLIAAAKAGEAEGWATVDSLDGDVENVEDLKVLSKIIAAYLEATQPEVEPDKIAVVVDAQGRAVGSTFYVGAEPYWKGMEQNAIRTLGRGPFARAIVECHLPRPAEPVAVQGRVK